MGVSLLLPPHPAQNDGSDMECQSRASRRASAGRNWPSPSFFVRGERPLVASMGTLEEGTPRWVKAGLRRGKGFEAKKGAGARGGEEGQESPRSWDRRWCEAGMGREGPVPLCRSV